MFDHFVKLALKGLRPHFRFQFCKVLQRMYQKIELVSSFQVSGNLSKPWTDTLSDQFSSIFSSVKIHSQCIIITLPIPKCDINNNYRHAVCIQKSLYYISINFWGSERFWRIILGKQDRNITYWIRYKCSTSILKRITIFLNTIIRKGLLTTHFKTIPTITRLAPPFLKIAHSPP